MTISEHTPQSDLPPFVGETPIDVVARGERLPFNLTLGYVDDSDRMSEVKVRRFTGIGSFGSEYASAFDQIRREYPHRPVDWDTEPRVHQLDAGTAVLWLPPAQVEIFSGLIVHPDRPGRFNRRKGDRWLAFAREQHEGDTSHEQYQVISTPHEDTTHVWVGGGARRGMTDWFQRAIPAERRVRILAATTIPDALTELTEPIRQNTQVTAERARRIVSFLIDAYQS